jgi:hypothetical protein
LYYTFATSLVEFTAATFTQKKRHTGDEKGSVLRQVNLYAFEFSSFELQQEGSSFSTSLGHQMRRGVRGEMEQLFNFHVNPKSQREVTCSRRREYDLE